MKFRVYDKQAGEYITDEDAYINTDGNLCFNEWDDLYGHYRMSVIEIPSDYYSEYYTVERYTGFTDKNGREIYEGDRVERKHEFGAVQSINGQWVIMRGGILLGSVAYQAADFEITGTAHDANCSEKANS